MSNKKTTQHLHLIVNWNSSDKFVKNSIAAHSLILYGGSDYVWYGKMMKNPKTLTEKVIKQMEFQLHNNIETHLYLYCPNYGQKIFHVGHIKEIRSKHPDEHHLIPPHYGKVSLNVSYWFKVTDFRELTYEMHENLLNEDGTLYDPVESVKYPVVVHERREYKFFDYTNTKGKKWFDLQKLHSDTIKQMVDPNFVFVIMPFNHSFDNIYEFGIKSTINNLGLKLKCERADEPVNTHRATMKIIRAKIREANLIIADVTGSNANVFYELGYAHALEKDTFVLIQDITKLPFDLNKFHVVEYSPNNLKKLTEDLGDRVKAHLTAHLKKK